MFSLWVSNVATWQHCSGWRLVYCYCCRCLPSPAQPIYSAPVPHKKPRAALRDINNNHCCCTALASCWIIDCGMRTVRTRDPGLLTTFLFPLPYRSSGGKRGCIFYLDSWQSFYPQCAEISVCRYSVHCGDWRCCELLLLSCRVWYSYCSILNFVTCADCSVQLSCTLLSLGCQEPRVSTPDSTPSLHPYLPFWIFMLLPRGRRGARGDSIQSFGYLILHYTGDVSKPSEELELFKKPNNTRKLFDLIVT